MDFSSLLIHETSTQSSVSTNDQNSCKKDFFLYGEKQTLFSDKIENYNPSSITSFYEKYRTLNKIYSNSLASSEITLVQDMEGNRFACKETRKKRLPNSYFHEFIKNEMVFQYSLSKYSDNIVKVLDYYEDENSYFMHSELDESLEEDEIFDKIKLTDFGLAHLVNTKTGKAYMKYRAGTMEYKAPEIKDDCYVDFSIDMWSFGISLYKMAVAYFPTAFNRYKYGSGPIPFRKTDWKEFEGGELIQDLILKCLRYNPEERITAAEALGHPWFKI